MQLTFYNEVYVCLYVWEISNFSQSLVIQIIVVNWNLNQVKIVYRIQLKINTSWTNLAADFLTNKLIGFDKLIVSPLWYPRRSTFTLIHSTMVNRIYRLIKYPRRTFKDSYANIFYSSSILVFHPPHFVRYLRSCYYCFQRLYFRIGADKLY